MSEAAKVGECPVQQQKYNAWGLYCDANDPRFIVPKRNPALGWTLNIGHKSARVFLAVAMIVIAGSVIGSSLLS